MANGVHLSQKSKVRSRKQKIEPKSIGIKSAKYVQDFVIALSFTNGKTRLVDFLPLFHRHVKGDNLKYLAPQNFKRFIAKKGNIYWGRNEDVIFPVSILLENENDLAEETLYII